MSTLPDLEILKTILSSNWGFNFLDIIIVFIILFYAFEGFSVGFLVAFSDFLSFAFSFLAAFKLYTFFGKFLVNSLSLPYGIANAIGFFIAATVSEIILNILFRKFFSSFYFGKSEISKILGIIPGIASSFILLSFILTLIASLPFSPFLKQTVISSAIGSKLISHGATIEKSLITVFGGAIRDTLNFLTIEPKSNETVALNFKTNKFSIDEEAEKKMFEILNKERTERGLPPLVFSPALTRVAREHSGDMFSRGYFSHYAPEGLSPFDRITRANIKFRSAGENLALAPSAELAMQGLMNSPGHKANILSTSFGKVGIGAADGGIYGEMFSQEFTN